MIYATEKGLKQSGQILVEKAYKAGANNGWKLSNISGSKIHEIVKNAGHAIGYKFKPWQAIKITKGAALGGKIFGIFGIGLSVFMQIHTDHEVNCTL